METAGFVATGLVAGFEPDRNQGSQPEDLPPSGEGDDVELVDFDLESCERCVLDTVSLGGQLSPDRRVLALPPAVVQAARKCHAYSASALIVNVRTLPAFFAEQLGLSEADVLRHIEQLIELLRGHVSDILLEDPEPIDVKYTFVRERDKKR